MSIEETGCPPRYSKLIDGVTLERMPPDSMLEGNAPVDLQITLGDMALDDAFRATLPPAYFEKNLRHFIDEFFPETDAERERIADSFDVRQNPDLPEIYLDLLDMIAEWRDGYSTLRFFINNGPEIDLGSIVAEYLHSRRSANGCETYSPVFDLVIEQTYDVLAKHAERIGDTSKLLDWLRGCTLVYFMDKHKFRPPVDTTERDWHSEFVIEDLRAKGLIAPNREATAYQLTRAGRRFIGHLISETESYIKHFDVFKDVEYDAELEVIRFGTGRGDDLRVQVYEAEGLDTIRVVFLLRLYDGTLDSHKNTWRDDIGKNEFFNEILRPVLDHDRADTELIDWIIESGYAHNEEQAELARERAAQREIIRRVSAD